MPEHLAKNAAERSVPTEINGRAVVQALARKAARQWEEGSGKLE